MCFHLTTRKKNPCQCECKRDYLIRVLYQICAPDSLIILLLTFLRYYTFYFYSVDSSVDCLSFFQN